MGHDTYRTQSFPRNSKIKQQQQEQQQKSYKNNGQGRI